MIFTTKDYRNIHHNAADDEANTSCPYDEGGYVVHRNNDDG